MADNGMEQHLPAGWYEAAAGFRWTAKTAIVRMHGPAKAGEKLHVTVHYPKAFLTAPVSLAATMASGDGPAARLGEVPVTLGGDAQDLEFPVPAQFLGSSEIKVTLEVSRTILEPGGTRQLGVPVSQVAIR